MWLRLLLTGVVSSSALPFISVWQTAEANETISLPINGSGYDLTIDWGDGNTSSFTSGVPSHTYLDNGNHTISIAGVVTSWAFKDAHPYRKNILDVQAWGEFTMDSTSENAFRGCTNLQVTASGQPIFLPGATLGGMFYMCTNFNAPLIWNITNVVNLHSMFCGAGKFNSIVNFSDSVNVKSVEGMFRTASKFNQPVILDTRSVTTMSTMFMEASMFNQAVNFVTNSVQSMNFMFDSATAFNQELNFNTSKVTTMNSMFNRARKFNKPVNFDVGLVTDMMSMFKEADEFNQPINFSASKSLANVANMFFNVVSFNQPVRLNLSKVSSLNGMFFRASSFNQSLDFDTSSIVTMNSMFADANNFTQNLISWNVSQVTGCLTFCSCCGLPIFPVCASVPCPNAIPPLLANGVYSCVGCASQAPTSSPNTEGPSAPPSSSPTASPSRNTSAPSSPTRASTVAASAPPSARFHGLTVILLALLSVLF